MDVTEHPAVIATNDLINEYNAVVSDGRMPAQLAYALLASDILACGVEVNRHGGPPPVCEYLIELASGFAVARRHEALVALAEIPNDASGLDGLDAPTDE